MIKKYKDYNFPQLIKLRRFNKNITQKELAIAMGVSTQSIVWWETGVKCPSVRSARLLKILLGGETETEYRK